MVIPFVNGSFPYCIMVSSNSKGRRLLALADVWVSFQKVSALFNPSAVIWPNFSSWPCIVTAGISYRNRDTRVRKEEDRQAIGRNNYPDGTNLGFLASQICILLATCHLTSGISECKTRKGSVSADFVMNVLVCVVIAHIE